MAQLDFAWFFRHYFPHYITREPGDLQEYLFDVGQRMLHGEGCSWFNVIGHKEGAKSAIITMGVPVAAACLGAHPYIAIMGHPKAIKDHQLSIIRELTGNRALLADFGDMVRPVKDIKSQLEDFNDKAVNLVGGTRIRFMTPGESLRGTKHQQHRPSLFIGDDVHSGRAFDSPPMLERHVKDVLSEGVGCLDMGRSAACILGNVPQSDSIQGVLAKNEAWETTVWPVRKADGSPRWFTEEELLERERSVGVYAWTRDYLCEEFDGSRAVFDWDDFAKFDFRRDLKKIGGEWMVGGDILERLLVSLDPSRGFDRQKPIAARRGDPDRAVLVLGARGRSGRIYILAADVLQDDARSERCFQDSQVAASVRMAAAWQPDVFCNEQNGFQLLLGQRMAEAFEEAGLGIRPVGFDSVGRKESRILSVQPDIARGDVVFADNLPEDYRREWGRFRSTGTPGHDDCMDATEVVIRRLRKKRPAFYMGPGVRVEAAA